MPTFKKVKWLPLILLLIFTMALTACGGDDDDDGGDNGDNASDNGGDDNGGSDAGSVTLDLAGGTTTVAVPDGWVSSGTDGDQQLWLASSDEALAKTDRSNTEPIASGEIAALVSPVPAGGVPPSALVDGMRAAASADDPFEFTGDAEEVTIGDYSGVRAPVGNPLAEGWGYFVTIDETYIVMVLGFTAPGEYNDDIDSTIRGIVQSASVAAPAAPDGDG